MASSSFSEFKYNILDAKRLHQAHGVLSEATPGKKGLGHITRSGVVMLCAAWERYHEAIIVEGVKYLSEKILDPGSLPVKVKEYLSRIAKESKHQLKPMELAGEGWRAFYICQVIDETKSLNTPKSANLQSLYSKCLGEVDVMSYWGIDYKRIDDFVKTRGEIAHNGRNSPYISASSLNQYISMIEQVASEHDNAFCDYLKTACSSTLQPWRKTAVKLVISKARDSAILIPSTAADKIPPA
jgi:hypothetical protein